jgi:hypothetical protein
MWLSLPFRTLWFTALRKFLSKVCWISLAQEVSFPSAAMPNSRLIANSIAGLARFYTPGVKS